MHTLSLHDSLPIVSRHRLHQTPGQTNQRTGRTTRTQKKAPGAGHRGRGRTWVGFGRGDDRRRERTFIGRAKKQDALEGKNPTFDAKIHATAMQVPRATGLHFHTRAYGDLIATARPLRRFSRQTAPSAQLPLSRNPAPTALWVTRRAVIRPSLKT